MCFESPDMDKKALPSPLQLRRKILVKAKRHQMSCSEEQPLPQAQGDSGLAAQTQLHPLNEASSQLLLEVGKNNKSMKAKKVQPRSASLSLNRAKSEKNNNARKGSAQFVETEISASFSALVNYCESVKFRGFDVPRQYWQMSSFDETKASQLIGLAINI